MELPLFLVPVVVGLLTQLSKHVLNKNWQSRVEMYGLKLPRYGGMPSAHTAFAFSLSTLAVLVDGFGSMTFAIAAAGTIFILDDALRMRVYLERHLKEPLGHTLPEVLVGALVGIVATVLLWLLIS